jgi:eukaryotic-like serine/threonine-protein kinase
MQARQTESTEIEWGSIKRLFQAALELEPAQRLGFLARECSSSALRDEVERLLLAHEDAGSFLKGNILSAANAFPQREPCCFAPGQIFLDRFRVVRFLARGGMGEVYEAEDLELGTRVAIKTIRPEIAGHPEMLFRFRREVHLAQQVTHPNACRIFDLFRHRSTEGDVVFVSMELLSGKTLADHLRETGRMSSAEFLPVLRQIASALDAAHSVGIVHRDLKPANILLEPGREGSIRAVVTDFGLAWSLDGAAEAPLTRSSQPAFGTLEYMSPEQIEGKELTPASDLYALGLVIYQAVTGARAFGSDTPVFSALRRLTEPSPLPSQTVAGLDPLWDRLVSGCLERDPVRRFQSVQQVTATLDGDTAVLPLSSTSVEGRDWVIRPSWVGRYWKPAVGVLAGCITLTTVGLLFWRWHHRPTPASQVTIVLADFINTTGEPIFDSALNPALQAKLQQSPFLNLMPDAKVRLALRYMGLPMQERLTQAVARQVCLREDGQVILQGTIAPESKGYDLSLKAFDCHSGKEIASREFPAQVRGSALTALDQAADAIRRDLGESVESLHRYDVPVEDASTSSLEALTAYSQGLRLSDEQGEIAAEPYFRHATEVDPGFAIAQARLSAIDWDLGETGQAAVAATKAYEDRDHTSEWERFFILSSYYAFATGELDKEMQTYEEWSKVYPDDTVWPTGLSIDNGYYGRFDKAVEMAQRQIRNTPETAAAYGNLALLYLAEERPDEARATLDQAAKTHLYEMNIAFDQYWLAFYENDEAGMNKVLGSATAYPGLQEIMLSWESETEAYHGRLRSAQEFLQRASNMAVHNGESESAAVWHAEGALWEAEFGQTKAAHADATQVFKDVAQNQSKNIQTIDALALATAGDTQLAQTLTIAIERAHPLDTLVNQYWIPVIRARIAIEQNKPAVAVKLLDSAVPYDTALFDTLPCMYSVYMRGQAYLIMHEGVEAAAEFRRVLAHRGLVLVCPTDPLSQLGLARALAMVHDTEGSRQAYRELLTLWKDADPEADLPRRAAMEYHALP